jgi:hypothetical protein
MDIKRIIREEIKDFDWIQEVPSKEEGKIEVGDVYQINPPIEQDTNNLVMTIKIISRHTDYGTYYTYQVLTSNDLNEPVGHKDEIDGAWAQELLDTGDWHFLRNENEESEEETLEEEGSMWDNDENWGTDKSYWGKDPNWGEGGSYDGGGDSGGDESDF